MFCHVWHLWITFYHLPCAWTCRNWFSFTLCKRTEKSCCGETCVILEPYKMLQQIQNSIAQHFQHERELKGIFYAMSPHEASCWIRVDPTLTLLGHSRSEAPLEPTVLTAVPGDLVDDAVSVSVAGVHHIFLHAAAEEALQRRQQSKDKILSIHVSMKIILPQGSVWNRLTKLTGIFIIYS